MFHAQKFHQLPVSEERRNFVVSPRHGAARRSPCEMNGERERRDEGRRKETERNPLSAINRIKDDFPRLDEMSRENSSNRVAEESQWPVDLLN